MPEALPGDPRSTIASLIDDGSPVVALHGFTQTGSSWAPVARACGLRLITPDLPGHGDASLSRPAALDQAADEIAARVSDTIGDRPAVWIGYSLGGRILLHLALRHPRVVSGLVLVSTTAGIEDGAERASRRAADDRLADRIEEIGVDAFLVEWLAQPLFRSLLVSDDDRLARASNTAPGLASSLRSCGTGTQQPLWDLLDEITVPTVIVAGQLDTKFATLAHRLGAIIGDSSVHILPGVGHACHLEDPGMFIRVALSRPDEQE